ncbi:MAG: hypothetical protein L6R36_000675 [Xanthoria steineri]|nr:MAG: hypothetical protein L6R36_000675 [Xanthoria steineri]
MGANQSTGSGGGGDTPHVKRCYYELLDVDRQATDDEIKKAYRKKALELHPDRNYGNVEETTKLFADIQSAYAVLSDPQERAWYDSHRNVILRGDDAVPGQHYEHDVRITTTDDIMKMLPKINACRDFSDSPSSFYGTLRGIFDTLAKEEELACEWQDIDPLAYPDFGNANGEHGTGVRSFYAAWSSFATKKDFAWVDIYRYSDAPDRRVRRLMEKENKRLREDAAREFNDAVRSLVAFVKKRDPRFKPNAQSEVDRQKVLRDAAAAQAARSRAANQAKIVETRDLPQWTQSTEPEASDDSDARVEEPKQVYECVVCDKAFKSEKQFEAHERSKKHVKAAQQVRREMQLEDESLHLEKEHSWEEKPTLSSDMPPPETREDEDSQDLEREVEALSVENNVRLGATNDESRSEQTSMTSPSRSGAGPEGTSASTSDDEYAERDVIEQRILGQHADPGDDLKPSDLDGDAVESTQGTATPRSDNTDDLLPQPKVGKAKAKRAKKAAQKSTGNASADAEFKCATCQSGFPSKTRLFNHIKDLGHAQPITKGGTGAKVRKK